LSSEEDRLLITGGTVAVLAANRAISKSFLWELNVQEIRLVDGLDLLGDLSYSLKLTEYFGLLGY
jgi:hypothetical protein